MALHARIDPRHETYGPEEKSRHSHLDRMIATSAASRFQGAAPEMNGGTTIVILPYCFDDEGNKLPAGKAMDDRLDSDPAHARGYNRWLFKARDRGVTRFGKNWLSMVFDNPDDAGWNFDNDHPVQLIYRHVTSVVNDKRQTVVETPYGSSVSDNWKVLRDGDGGGGKVYGIIKRPEVMYIVYALVYQSGKDNYALNGGNPLGASTDDKLPVFVMSQSTASALFDKMDTPISNLRVSDGLLHPQITGCKFIHFYDKQVGTCPAMQAAAAAASGGAGFGTTRRGPTARAGEQAKVGFGYDVHISNTLDGTERGATINRDAVIPFAASRTLPWDKVIHGYGPEECADLVQGMCKLPLSVLDYAWREHPEFINSITKALMNQKVTSAPRPTAPRTQAAPPQSFDFSKPPEAPASMTWDALAASQNAPAGQPTDEATDQAPEEAVLEVEDNPFPTSPTLQQPTTHRPPAPVDRDALNARLRAAIHGAGAPAPGSTPNPPQFRPGN